MSFVFNSLMVNQSHEVTWKHKMSIGTIATYRSTNTKLPIRKADERFQIELRAHPTAALAATNYWIFNCSNAVKDPGSTTYHYDGTYAYFNSYPNLGLYINGHFFSIPEWRYGNNIEYYFKYTFESVTDCTVEVIGLDTATQEIFVSLEESCPLTYTALLPDNLLYIKSKDGASGSKGTFTDVIVRYDMDIVVLAKFLTNFASWQESTVITATDVYDENNGALLFVEPTEGQTLTASLEKTGDIKTSVVQLTPKLIRVNLPDYWPACGTGDSVIVLTNQDGETIRVRVPFNYDSSPGIRYSGYKSASYIGDQQELSATTKFYRYVEVPKAGGTFTFKVAPYYRDYSLPYRVDGAYAYYLNADGTEYSVNPISDAKYRASSLYQAGAFSFSHYHDTTNSSIVHLTVNATANNTGDWRYYFIDSNGAVIVFYQNYQ